MSEVQPPVPEPDALSAPFWEACRNGALEFSACDDCGHYFLPAGPCCPDCWSPCMSSRAASGRGHVFSFAVYRRTYHPGMPAPYVVALIELEEGPRLISNVVGCAPEEVAIDMPVQLRFEPAGDFMLPRFAPVGDEKETS
ncbi:MAG: hypothetical protein GY937_23800 [bacterium]|nr:hypothetical protein [bacterium]